MNHLVSIISRMWIGFLLSVFVPGCASGLTSSGKDAPLPPPEYADSVAAQHIVEGNRLFFRQRLRDAATKYQAAIDAQSSLGEAHYNLGLALYKRGLYADARPHFKKAAQLEPYNTVIRNAPPFRKYGTVKTKTENETHDGHFGHQH